jgi:DNA-binding NarL/FixJ family response regulator
VPSLVVIDDDPDVRLLIRRLADGSDGHWTVVGEAASGDAAILRSRRIKPDIILLDAGMPGLSGLETAAHILADTPDQRIVLFTAYRDVTLETAAANLRIQGCISKSEFHRLLSRLHPFLGDDALSPDALSRRDGQP